MSTRFGGPLVVISQRFGWNCARNQCTPYIALYVNQMCVDVATWALMVAAACAHVFRLGVWGRGRHPTRHDEVTWPARGFILTVSRKLPLTEMMRVSRVGVGNQVQARAPERPEERLHIDANQLARSWCLLRRSNIPGCMESRALSMPWPGVLEGSAPDGRVPNGAPSHCAFERCTGRTQVPHLTRIGRVVLSCTT